MSKRPALEDPWCPISVGTLAQVFSQSNFPWWIAGGVAVDLAVGRTTRTHSDVDVFILRPHARELRRQLQDWQCFACDPPGSLREWLPEETLHRSVHDIWCRAPDSACWQMQVMIDDAVDGRWQSRRNSRVTASIDEISLFTDDGVRYLAPHIQLFYKAKNPRPKDEKDLAVLLDAHSNAPSDPAIESKDASIAAFDFDVEWLSWAISITYGADHPWIERLARQYPPK